MDKRIKTKWIKALRSGKYHQGREKLIQTDGYGDPQYCCLGVLCSVMGKTDKQIRTMRNGGDRNQLLSTPFAESLGIDFETQEHLASRNDNGETFKLLANYIEQKL